MCVRLYIFSSSVKGKKFIIYFPILQKKALHVSKIAACHLEMQPLCSEVALHKENMREELI